MKRFDYTPIKLVAQWLKVRPEAVRQVVREIQREQHKKT